MANANKKFDPTKYNCTFHPQLILWIARWGLNQDEIAKELGIPPSLLEEWKHRYGVIQDALERGREYWGELAEVSLQKLIKGYSYEETEVTQIGEGDQVRRRARRTTRHVPPNVQAVIYQIENGFPNKLFRIR